MKPSSRSFRTACGCERSVGDLRRSQLIPLVTLSTLSDGIDGEAIEAVAFLKVDVRAPS